jgi:hypothetical protein
MTDRMATPQSARRHSPELTQAEIQDIRNRCQYAMRQRVPGLAAQVVESLRKSEPAYRNGPLPPEEPPLWIGRSIGRVLDAIRMPVPEVPSTLDLPRQIGTRRARQGVPQRSLLQAYHIGGRVLSTAFTRWSVEEDLGSQRSATLLDGLWDVIDTHSAAAVASLRTTQAGLTGHHAAGYLLDELLNGETDESTAAAVARSLALPEGGRYAVVVREPGPGREPVRAGALVPYARGVRLIWRMHGERAIAVVVLGDESLTRLGGALAAHGCRTGVSTEVTGLDSLGRAREQAELALSTLRGGGLAFLEERLPAALLIANPALAGELQLRVLAPMLALEESRGHELLRTLEAWLTANGSVAKTAADLHCHRNTVLNRLRRIEALTGRSTSAPRDLIDLGLALEAFRQFGDARGTHETGEDRPGDGRRRTATTDRENG